MSQWQRKLSRLKKQPKKTNRKHRLTDQGMWRLEDRTVPTTFSQTSAGAVTTIADNPSPTNPLTVVLSVPAGEVITDLRVTLNNLVHVTPEDIDMILVAPDGATYIYLMSDAGDSNSLLGVTFTLRDDGADGPLTTGPINGGGNYLPTNIDQSDPDTIPGAPASTAGLVTSFAGFRGVAANGTWTLRIQDDAPGNEGAITSFTLAGTSRLNAAPVANADTFPMTEDTVLTVNAPGVLSNDTDANSDPLTAVLLAGPSNGALTGGTINANGSFTYTPRPNFAGTDTFTYRAYDGVSYSAPATVTINIANVNDPPTAVNDTYVLQNGGPQTVHRQIGITSNDVDPDGAIPTNYLNENFQNFALIPFPTGTGGGDGTDWTEALPFGWVRDNTTTPAPVDPTGLGAEYFGWHILDIDSWIAEQGGQQRDLWTHGGVGMHGQVMVADGDAYDDSSNVNHPPVNGPPDLINTYLYTPAVSIAGVVPGSLKLNFDSSFRPEEIGQIAEVDVSFDGGATWTNILHYDTANTPGGQGSLSRVDEQLSLDITPTAGATAAKFRFGYLEAGNDWWWAIDNVKVKGDRTDSSTLTPNIVTPLPAAAGTLALNPNGGFVYTPAAGFTGATSFTYNVFDGVVTSNTATVNITVNANNVAPVAVADPYTTNQGVLLTVPYESGLLVNDSDADIGGTNVGLKAVLVAGPTAAQGTLALNQDGTFTFTPNPAFFGAATFTYKANDGSRDSNTVTVGITVISTNLNPPVAGNDASFSTNEGASLTVPAPGVLANDTDADGNPLTAVLLVGPNHGTLTFNADGSFVYTPNTYFSGAETFTYRAFDGNFFSAPATVTITVNDVNSAPRGIPDYFSTAFNAPLTVSAANGVLRNDQDDGPSVELFTTQGFQGLTLIPFNTGVAGGDGTDFTDQVPASWSVVANPDYPHAASPTTPGYEFDGWRAMDVDSWWQEQGGTTGQNRTDFTRGGVGSHGTVMVADGDAFDDFIDIDTTKMNTYLVTPSITLGSIQPNSLTLDFDSSFRPENANRQRGEVDVSYDGGTTWTDILDLNQANSGGTGSRNRTNEHPTVDAFNPAGATTAQFRFGYLNAGNDWWWALDNVHASGRNATAGATQTAINFTQPAHGAVTGTSTAGAFTYTPTAGYRGLDTFTYQPRDGVNTGNVTTVTVLVGTQAAVQVDDGTAQRSMVRSATVYFSSPPTFAWPIFPGTTNAAFTLTGPGAVAVPFTVLSIDKVGSLTAVKLGGFTGALTQNGSLADGRYTLTAVSSQITIGGQALDGNNDGTPGGDSVTQLYRFYGDVSGTDSRVDIADFGFFSLAYLTPANYNSILDFNVDGRIDIADFGQFSVRYFTSLP